jgi:NAD(P)-dependent dehydrogenase (short-subunit alcohol dehydrogenase family)
MGRLSGKVALVTGGAQGIGAACVVRMAQEGAKVAIVDILDSPGKALAEEVGANARYFHADTSSESQAKRAIADTLREFGRIDVLVNNAGISGVNKPTHEITEKEWDRVQAVNVKGVFFFTKHAYQPMRASGGGSIINLSSIYGLVGAADIPPYHASKGAVRLMTKVDALFYARDGIRVNSIHPGFVWTPLVEHYLAAMGGDLAAMGGDLADRRKALDELHPIGRMGDPDDIAWAVVYLASDESKFVTGSELVVDGGYSCR